MSTQGAFAFDDADAFDDAVDADDAAEADAAVDVVAGEHAADDVLGILDAQDLDDDLLQADAEPAEPVVEIRTSARRRRTVTAYREGERTIVLVPARMPVREREKYAAELVERLRKREARTRRSDDDLMKRAGQLSRRWLDGRAKPAGVRWVGNQRTRWGSCTPADGTIRLSDRMRGMPAYVVDAVLLHELAHLIHPDHSPAFHALLTPFPDHERAQAYLEGVAYGQDQLRDVPRA
jgi:hypothetical protein